MKNIMLFTLWNYGLPVSLSALTQIFQPSTNFPISNYAQQGRRSEYWSAGKTKLLARHHTLNYSCRSHKVRIQPKNILIHLQSVIIVSQGL